MDSVLLLIQTSPLSLLNSCCTHLSTDLPSSWYAELGVLDLGVWGFAIWGFELARGLLFGGLDWGFGLGVWIGGLDWGVRQVSWWSISGL